MPVSGSLVHVVPGNENVEILAMEAPGTHLERSPLASWPGSPGTGPGGHGEAMFGTTVS